MKRAENHKNICHYHCIQLVIRESYLAVVIFIMKVSRLTGRVIWLVVLWNSTSKGEVLVASLTEVGPNWPKYTFHFPIPVQYQIIISDETKEVIESTKMCLLIFNNIHVPIYIKTYILYTQWFLVYECMMTMFPPFISVLIWGLSFFSIAGKINRRNHPRQGVKGGGEWGLK